MSKLRAFTIRDSKAEAYNSPFFMTTRGQAERGFMDACKDEKGDFFHHLEDYSLWEIGEFDTALGTLIPAEHGPVLMLQATGARNS